MLSGNLPDIDSDMLSCIACGIPSGACMFGMYDGYNSTGPSKGQSVDFETENSPIMVSSLGHTLCNLLLQVSFLDLPRMIVSAQYKYTLGSYLSLLSKVELGIPYKASPNIKPLWETLGSQEFNRLGFQNLSYRLKPFESGQEFHRLGIWKLEVASSSSNLRHLFVLRP